MTALSPVVVVVASEIDREGAVLQVYRQSALSAADLLNSAFVPLFANTAPRHYRNMAKMCAAYRLTEAHRLLVRRADEAWLQQADEGAKLVKFYHEAARRFLERALEQLMTSRGYSDTTCDARNQGRQMLFEYRYARAQVNVGLRAMVLLARRLGVLNCKHVQADMLAIAAAVKMPR